MWLCFSLALALAEGPDVTPRPPPPLEREPPAAKSPDGPAWWVFAVIGGALLAGAATAVALSADARGGPPLGDGTGSVRGRY